jgi:hypothetical protein
MPQVAGVTTKKNVKGEITHVTINVKKHKDIITPVLEEIGVLTKMTFEERFKKAHSVEEAKQMTLNHLRKIWKK